MDEKIQKCKEQLDTYYNLFLQSLDNLAKTIIKTKIDFEQLKVCDNFNKINDRYKLSETILNVYNGQKSVYEKMMNLKAEYEAKIKNLHTDNSDSADDSDNVDNVDSENTFSQDKPVKDNIEPESIEDNIEENIEPESIEPENIEEHNKELDTEETKCENMPDLDETTEEPEKDTEIDCEVNQTVKTEESSSVKKRGRPRKVS
jgi:hypothetical protein